MSSSNSLSKNSSISRKAASYCCLVLTGLSVLFTDLLHFNGSSVDFVVFCVSTDELDEDNSGLIGHGYNETARLKRFLLTAVIDSIFHSRLSGPAGADHCGAIYAT